MANVNAPFGLSPASHLQDQWQGQGRVYCILASDAAAYAIGDPVTLAGTGDTAGVPAVTLATAGGANPVLGSIMGLGTGPYGGAIGVNPGVDSIIAPASKTKNYYVLVSDDPYIIYAVQEDNAQTPLAVGDIGNNISLKAGANNGYASTWTLDNATKATTATLQMKIMAFRQISSNTLGAGGVWLCMINNHPFKAGIAGI